mmetsp:Transcript_95850/g.257669  ORF Transcript_95850/g.257669 Transcript_95850/m.257669 type:complete len:90 (+) Transcript_95850:310-579(+)
MLPLPPVWPSSVISDSLSVGDSFPKTFIIFEMSLIVREVTSYAFLKLFKRVAAMKSSSFLSPSIPCEAMYSHPLQAHHEVVDVLGGLII